MGVSFCIHPSRKRLDSLKGWLSGWCKTFSWKPKPIDEVENYWRTEAQKDIEHTVI